MNQAGRIATATPTNPPPPLPPPGTPAAATPSLTLPSRQPQPLLLPFPPPPDGRRPRSAPTGAATSRAAPPLQRAFITAILTADDLLEAVVAGAPHIEIRSHLDLRGLRAAPNLLVDAAVRERLGVIGSPKHRFPVFEVPETRSIRVCWLTS